jgi:hypothetical protein
VEKKAQVERLVPPGFYETYISVIYAVLAGTGLEELTKQFLSRSPSISTLLLFGGVFVASVHFWMVCLSSDPLSDAAYLILERNPSPRMFNLFLVIDILFATAFAGALFFMFRSVSLEAKLFFAGFSALAGLSLAYDLCSMCVAAFAFLRLGDGRNRAALERYVKTYGSWLWQDSIYVTIALSFYFLSQYYYARFPLRFATVFALVSFGGLVLDAILLHPSLYREIQLRR